MKTLPHHYYESDKTRFLDEIRIMKEIGFHVHLVSMIGCNCFTESPLLVMELAEENLLHYLIHNSGSIVENEPNPQKRLLSIAWQVSDGMVSFFPSFFIIYDL